MATPNIENYLPVVQYNGLNTAKNVSLKGTNTLSGATTISGAATLSGATTISGALTLSSTVQGMKPVVSSGNSSVALTAAQSGEVVLFDNVAGLTFTLPAPAVGLNYTFMASTTVTSNTFKIITDAGTTLLLGGLIVGSGTSTVFVANNSTHIAIGMNGTTTGGVIGSEIQCTCVDSTHWLVSGFLNATGQAATPFFAQ